jgi:cytochrome c oxidase subunit 2
MKSPATSAVIRVGGSALESRPHVFDALRGAGQDAAEIAGLFRVMVAGAAVIWLIVTGLALHAMRSRRSLWSERAGLLLIAIGGGVVPTVILAALLAYGMPTLARQLHTGTTPSVRITVVGEQWWWRVRYELPGRTHVELANEVRLPRDRTTAVTLTSSNVIHSFWIPALAGKVDMLPGRTTHLTLEPAATGTYRGLCAEYCGASHARMAFIVEVMEPDAFEQWLSAQGLPATPVGNDVTAGATAFLRHGCGACHGIRGSPAVATIGPDLTHVGSRRSIAAASLPNQPDDIARFIARPGHIKPGALMPPFAMLPPDQLHAIAAYLRSLQ